MVEFTAQQLVDAKAMPSELLLLVLQSRAGHPGALAEAALLCVKKSQDYNSDAALNIHNIARSNYFPFGAVSYAQMLHTKSQRFNSLVQKEIEGGEANFEGLRDTALDIINYAGFYIASLDGTPEVSEVKVLFKASKVFKQGS
jgi:hypothetical protein